MGQTLNEITFTKEAVVFRNVSMMIRKGFQIELDILVLTSNFALVLEVKNIAGSLIFNEEERKTVRIRENGQIDEFDCYIHQLDRQISGFQQFLSMHGFSLPVSGAIVLSNQNTVVKKRSSTFPLLYRKQLARHVRTLQSSIQVHASHHTHQLTRLIRSRVKDHHERPLFEKMNLTPLLFRRGVLCLHCNQRIHTHQGRGWYCRICKLPGSEALRQAVEDRLLLISEEITNKQCREFLMIRHPAQATRILKSLELDKLGKPPGTIYRKLGKGPLKWSDMD